MAEMMACKEHDAAKWKLLRQTIQMVMWYDSHTSLDELEHAYVMLTVNSNLTACSWVSQLLLQLQGMLTKQAEINTLLHVEHGRDGNAF